MDERNKRGPEFIIAGASKTGTEWLRSCLRKHPDIYVHDGPSVDYFSKNYHKSDEWYEKFFEDSGNRINVDKSTSYIVYKKSAERIWRYDSSVDIMFILRDPIERAYSHYCMHLKAGKVSDKIEEEITLKSRYVQEGFYSKHISRFIDLFGKKQVHIFFFEKLCKNPKEFWLNVLKTMGADKTVIPQNVYSKHHTRKSRPKFEKIYRAAVSANRYLRRRSEWFNKIYWFMSEQNVLEYLHRLNEGDKFPKLTENMKRKLSDTYRDDIKNLQEMVDEDLSQWLDC